MLNLPSTRVESEIEPIRSLSRQFVLRLRNPQHSNDTRHSCRFACRYQSMYDSQSFSDVASGM